MSAVQVLHEGVPGDDHLCCLVGQEAAHRSQPVFESAVL
jgi:hypothetical protein